MYVITKNKFAPKRAECQQDAVVQNSHGIIYRKCNFKCAYCELRNRPDSDFREYSAEEFENLVKELILYGKGFKFTGGEPTLNLNLKRDMQIVRDGGGTIYLDTNGSNPKVVKELLDLGLVDVLGLSLKGLDPKQCKEVANVKNVKLVWDNVFEIMDHSAGIEKVRTIVTYVVNSDSILSEVFETVYKLLEKYPDFYIKINNLMENPETHQRSIYAVDPQKLIEETEIFLARHPDKKGKVILILSDSAVEKYDSIKFF